MKNKILLDIDGVIADFFRGFAGHLNKNLGAKIDLSQEPLAYGIHDWGHNLSKELIDREIPIWMEVGGYINMPIYPGAVEFIYKLMDKYDVYIVTARIGDFRKELPKAIQAIVRRDTQNWFRNHGIPADKLFFEHKKIDFCKNNEISIIIEDKLSTVIEGAQSNIQSILVNRGWNQKGDTQQNSDLRKNHPNIHIAYDYNNILNIMDGILNES